MLGSCQVCQVWQALTKKSSSTVQHERGAPFRTKSKERTAVPSPPGSSVDSFDLLNCYGDKRIQIEVRHYGLHFRVYSKGGEILQVQYLTSNLCNIAVILSVYILLHSSTVYHYYL